MQLGWGGRTDGDVPNEDSRLVEFDEGNLFALSRFPGRDRARRARALNLGLAYTRVAPGGERLSLVAGRVLRFGDDGQFADDTGLGGDASDWLAAAQPRG